MENHCNFCYVDLFPLAGIYTINSEYALVIKSVEKEDHGTYVCRAQNSEGFGHDSIPIYVEIKGRNTVFHQGIRRKRTFYLQNRSNSFTNLIQSTMYMKKID